MIDIEKLDKKTLDQKWQVITDDATCPYPLKPFVGSRLLSNITPEDDPRTTTLLVELRLGTSSDHVLHLGNSLASLFDLPRDSVWVEHNAASARRVEITIVRPEED